MIIKYVIDALKAIRDVSDSLTSRFAGCIDGESRGRAAITGDLHGRVTELADGK
jgi:hypothetical protein